MAYTRTDKIDRLQKGVAMLKLLECWPQETWRRTVCDFAVEGTTMPSQNMTSFISSLNPDEWDSLQLPEPSNTTDRPPNAVRKRQKAQTSGISRSSARSVSAYIGDRIPVPRVPIAPTKTIITDHTERKSRGPLLGVDMTELNTMLSPATQERIRQMTLRPPRPRARKK